jgi:hypothetical protein
MIEARIHSGLRINLSHPKTEANVLIWSVNPFGSSPSGSVSGTFLSEREPNLHIITHYIFILEQISRTPT